MKNVYLLILFLYLGESYAQLPHQSQQPPINPGYPFSRSMFVDCADEIITDIMNGNPLNLRNELFLYIRKSYTTYIILSDLEGSGIFSDPQKRSALRSFIRSMRINFPGVQIGISGDEEYNFIPTVPVSLSPLIGNHCFPSGNIFSMNDFYNVLNNAGTNSTNLKRSELSKFFYRAAEFGYDSTILYRGKISFDAFVLKHKYWQYTSSLTTIQTEFEKFKSVLSVMNALKCGFYGIKHIDAEFLPTEIFNLQAWTAIDQITEADPLITRMIVPAFTNNADGIFDQICKIMHFLTDQFSKPRTEFFVGLSAESPAFQSCNNAGIPSNHLGNYLNGTTSPSGNMYSVEKKFLDKFNNPFYMCASCSCLPFAGNHYSPNYTKANILAGSVWRSYNLLKSNNLLKENTDELFHEKTSIAIYIIDIKGRIIQHINTSEKFQFNYSTLEDGIYFLKTVFDDGSMQLRKIFIAN